MNLGCRIQPMNLERTHSDHSNYWFLLQYSQRGKLWCCHSFGLSLHCLSYLSLLYLHISLGLIFNLDSFFLYCSFLFYHSYQVLLLLSEDTECLSLQCSISNMAYGLTWDVKSSALTLCHLCTKNLYKQLKKLKMSLKILVIANNLHQINLLKEKNHMLWIGH